MAAPTESQLARLKLAIVQKAVRLLVLPEAPFGSFGEITEYGRTAVRPDFAIKELLYGFRGKDFNTYDEDGELVEEFDIDDVVVTSDDVIRMGFDDPEVFTAEREADVDAAIDAAKSWVADYIAGVGVA